MGWASERQIEDFNDRYESDEDFRRAYDEQMAIDAWEEAVFFEREREQELLEEWFDDKLIDVRGRAIELHGINAVQLVDDDLPF